MPTWMSRTRWPPRSTGMVSRRTRAPPGEAHGLVGLAGAALGVHELEELVVELRPEEIPQQRLGARALGAAPAGVADHLRDRAERGVEVLHEAPPQERVREPADHDEDPEQDRRVPEGESEAHAERRPDRKSTRLNSSHSQIS